MELSAWSTAGGVDVVGPRAPLFALDDVLAHWGNIKTDRGTARDSRADISASIYCFNLAKPCYVIAIKLMKEITTVLAQPL